MTFDFAALECRIAALESAQTASLRFGRVTGIKSGKEQQGGVKNLTLQTRAESLARP